MDDCGGLDSWISITNRIHKISWWCIQSGEIIIIPSSSFVIGTRLPGMGWYKFALERFRIWKCGGKEKRTKPYYPLLFSLVELFLSIETNRQTDTHCERGRDTEIERLSVSLFLLYISSWVNPLGTCSLCLSFICNSYEGHSSSYSLSSILPHYITVGCVSVYPFVGPSLRLTWSLTDAWTCPPKKTACELTVSRLGEGSKFLLLRDGERAENVLNELGSRSIYVCDKVGGREARDRKWRLWEMMMMRKWWCNFLSWTRWWWENSWWVM